MKKIIGLVLALVLLTSVFAVLPAMAEDEATITDVAVHLDQGITLVYKLSDGGYEYVPVAAKELNDVAGPDGDNEDKFDSVKGYVTRLLAETDDEITEDLVNAMLNYGAAAQNYFNYQTDNLVGTPVTDTAALVAAGAPEIVVNDESGIYLGVSLVLEGTLKLRFYFKGNDLEVECDNNTPAVTNVGDNCYVDVPFMPYDIAEPVTVTTGTTSVTYAPINYLKAKANDADEKLVTMVASIYAYSVAAKAYYIEYNCEHKGIILNTVVVPTIFTEGLASGICPDCGKDVTEVLPVNTPTVTKVDYVLKAGETDKKNKAPIARESMQLSEVLGEGEHFYPTNANPEGKSLYIEFSMLLNETMNNFVNTNMTFPGIYTADSLSSDNGESAFWFYLRTADGIDKGKCDDWGSNAVDKDNPDMYYNNQTALAFDGWHRFGFEFHQNTTINGDNVTYTVTVSMYVDGVKVYEAVLGKKDATKSILLYTAEVVDGETIYTDRADAYAAFFRYTMYVSDAANPAYLVYADQHMGTDGFAVSVSPVENPTVGTFEVEEGKTVTAKQYFKVLGQSDCDLGNHNWADVATVDKAATCTEDGQKSIKCTVCKTVKDGTVEVIPAAHTWGGYTVDTEATCTTNGQKSIKCTVCGETDANSIEVIPAAHTWAENATVDVAATCTTNGSESIKCTVCNATKPDSTVTIPATGHKGVPVITVPTFFSEGYEQGTCTTCGTYVDGIIAKTEVDITTVTATAKDELIINEYVKLSDVLADGQHFYPTADNKDGNSLYVEFSMLLNGSMDNLKGSNISFPGIYTNEYLDPDYGHSAFWFFLRDGDAAKGKCDDWTSNAIKELGYYNSQNALAFDGWHRIGVEFHQNTTIDYEKKTVSYTMTVTMYYDGVRVYEATLGNGTKPAAQELLLYTAKFDGDNVVYTDCVDSYAAYYSYNAYVNNSNDPAYLITADKYATCGNDGFVLDVYPVAAPEAGTFTQDGVTVSGKHYFTLEPATSCIHNNTTSTVETISTVFTNGISSVKCTDCGETWKESIPMTTADMNAVTKTETRYFYESVKIQNILDGKHFYPTEDDPYGNDLLIEFSILLNGTMDNLNSDGKAVTIKFPGIFKDEWMTPSKGGDSLHWFYLQASGNQFKGSFELYNSIAVGEIVGPPCQGSNPDNYLSITEFDGWHRIGVRYHHTFTATESTMTVTLYIDGNEVSQYKVPCGGDKAIQPLIWAEFDSNGNAIPSKYEDYESRYAGAYNFNVAVNENGQKAYVPIADVYITCGDDFVLDVSPVDNPEAKDFTQDGVTLSGREYFTVNND